MPKPEYYADLRVVFRKEVEDLGDGEIYTSFTPHSIERINEKGITPDELEALGEHFGQMDSYQFMAVQDFPTALCDGGKVYTDL